MFENLDDEIGRYSRATVSRRESLLKWSLASLASAIVVLGIYLVA